MKFYFKNRETARGYAQKTSSKVGDNKQAGVGRRWFVDLQATNKKA